MANDEWHPWVKRERRKEAERNRAEIRARIRANRKLEEMGNGRHTEVDQKTQQTEDEKSLKWPQDWIKKGFGVVRNFVKRRNSDVVEKRSESVSELVEKEEPRSIEYTVPKGMRKIVVTINGKKSYTITNYISIESGDTIKLEVK